MSTPYQLINNFDAPYRQLSLSQSKNKLKKFKEPKSAS